MNSDFADPALRVSGVDFSVQLHLDFVAQRRCQRVVEVLVKLDQAGMTKARSQTQHGAHAEFALVHGAGVGYRAQHIDRALVHLRDHARQVLRLQLMRLHDLQKRVRRRVRMTARGMVFERGFSRRPAAAEPVGELAHIGIARHAGGHALRAFQNLGRAGETVFGQISRHQTSASGMRGVQLFGVSGSAQEFPQARRLCAG